MPFLVYWHAIRCEIKDVRSFAARNPTIFSRERPQHTPRLNRVLVGKKRDKDLPKLSIENVADSVALAAKMSLKEKETQFDEIYKEQPNLLASVLVLHKMGRTYEEMDVLFHILLVIHLSLKESGTKIETVSEDLQEQQLTRYIGHVKFMDDLTDKDQERALSDYMENHGEMPLMAYAITQMREAGFPYKRDEDSKQLMLCGMNLVNCIAAAKIA